MKSTTRIAISDVEVSPRVSRRKCSHQSYKKNTSMHRKRARRSQYDIAVHDGWPHRGLPANSNPGTCTGSVNTTVCSSLRGGTHQNRYQVTTGHGLKPPAKDGRLPAKTKVDLDAFCVWPDNSISAQVTPPEIAEIFFSAAPAPVWRRITWRCTGRCQSVRNRQQSSDAVRGFRDGEHGGSGEAVKFWKG
jgi:hypothetical protein